MYCADCGAKMYVHRTSNGKRIAQYTCSAYSKVPFGTRCPTQHRVNADAVIELIKTMLKAISEYSQNDREEFLRVIRETQAVQQSEEFNQKKDRIGIVEKRISELEKLILRIYEDNILGRLSDDRYTLLDQQYAKEQQALEQALEQGAIRTYALSGQYPQSLNELLEDYHITYDHSHFVVEYMPNGSNLLPSISVIPLSDSFSLRKEAAS